MIRYRSDDEDSARWARFPFRTGDVVLSSRSKHGTTWTQMVLALLVHRTPDLPAPLAELSPWLDHTVTPLDEVLARLAAQPHRRIVKTHTPLDGVPADDRVTYVVAARHPLDAAVSLHHQAANLTRVRPPLPPLEDWLRAWIDADPDPRASLDSLPGVLHHLVDAWSRREQPNVVLVHYADLAADLGGEMNRLAAALDPAVDDAVPADLVAAAGFEAMRSAADRLAPDPGGVLKDRQAFFRRGSSGAAREVLDPAAIARYRERCAGVLPPDLDAWLHRPD